MKIHQNKRALITGITGQDGSYLAEFLLEKGYEVHGIKRRSSSFNTQRIDHLYKDPHEQEQNFILHYGDMTDSSNLINIIQSIKPHEIYNLAAQSHVQVSFESPEYTANADALGTLRILEAIKILKLNKKTKFYQASTSEIFGNHKKFPLTLNTTFKPVSPYGTSKLFSYWITKNYRDAYGIFASNGILFNHESPIRGETFVTQKIIQGLVRIKNGHQKKLFLGNLYSMRDWGHAKDYVEAMWKMLQKKKPDDYVIGTGKTFTIKDFVNRTAKKLELKIKWIGKGLNEKAVNLKNKKVIVECKKRYFRPLEVDFLKGNASKAKKILRWSPKTSIDDLIDEMIQHEFKISNDKYK